MGIGDSVGKAAENAMEDLAGTAEKSDDGHVPDPGNPQEDIRVHSSISEGSNASDADDPTGPGGLPEPEPGDLRADPSEADEDPSASTGRG